MQQSSNYTSEDVKTLREHTGAGFTDCRDALEKFSGDWWLAAGYLKYRGCAIAVWSYDEHGNRQADNEAWAIRRAQQYKQANQTNPDQTNRPKSG